VGDNLTLVLKPTKDIAADLGKQKAPGQVLVGFALETNNEAQNAAKKLSAKGLDFIVLNSLNDQGAGFGFDTNKITIISKSGESVPFQLKPKDQVAADIVDVIYSYQSGS
jgi:phosphopantothenoylcysteine decarboxylase/phosphopantothenate--cysteine ligase